MYVHHIRRYVITTCLKKFNLNIYLKLSIFLYFHFIVFLFTFVVFTKWDGFKLKGHLIVTYH